MKCTWIIQTNMSVSQTEEYTAACEELELPYVHFVQIPFTNELPELDIEFPYVFVGSTTVVELANKKYPYGVFFNELNFSPQAYKLHYGDHYLNSDQVILKVKDLKDYLLKNESIELYFVKCNNDSKQIPGQVMDFEELIALAEVTEANYIDGAIYTPESEIVLSSPKHIDSEYRLVVVGKKVVSGSQYLPKKDPHIPARVIQFAESLAREWTPHDVFVMDICTIEDELKVVECNCFNAAGLYKADMISVLTAVSLYQEAEFAVYQYTGCYK